MGLFDYIRIKMPLPADPPPPSVEFFQTKDVPTLQLWMEQWTIEADGRLIKHGVRYEDRSDPNAKPGSLESIIGSMTSVPEPEQDEIVPHHGDICFGHFDTQSNQWWEYTARFTEGICTRIWCSEHRGMP
jgi:hypothetical protein